LIIALVISDIIIALLHAAIYDYRLNLVISILLSPWHTPQFMIIAWTWWYRLLSLDTRRNLWLSPWTWCYRYYYPPWQFTVWSLSINWNIILLFEPFEIVEPGDNIICLQQAW
jgi:hypothetical protein